MEISPELKTELEARLAEFEKNPETGFLWEQIKSHPNDDSWRFIWNFSRYLVNRPYILVCQSPDFTWLAEYITQLFHI